MESKDLKTNFPLDEKSEREETPESTEVKSCAFSISDDLPGATPLPSEIQPLRTVLKEALMLAAGTTSTEEQEVLVVCGTAFIMSDVRYLLGVEEPRDEDL